MKTLNVVLLGVSFVVGVVAIICGLNCYTTIPAGHVGVVTTFGAVGDKKLAEGFNLVAPWKTVHKLSIRTQEDKETADVPTKDGLSVRLEVSLLFSLKAEQAPTVFQQYGPEYKNIIVTPQFRSVLRNATAHFEAKDLYTANRSKIEGDLLESLKATMKEEGVIVEAVLLRDVQLPDTVKKAIERKLAVEQEAQQMEYTIKKEKLEAERKRVEAKGIADAQAIIQGTLTEAYLHYLWIDALKTAANHNCTMIYIPTGGDGLPIVKEVNSKPPMNKK